jgi:hypothetical protein
MEDGIALKRDPANTRQMERRIQIKREADVQPLF